MDTVFPAQRTEEQALRRLHSLLICDAAAEDELAALEAQAAEYHKSRQALQRDIFYYRAIIAPVRLLPQEILTHIFGFLVDSAPDAVFHASRVCRTWRSATMVSHLWSNIVITSETHAALQKVRLFLQRSNKVPLDITFIQSTPHYCHWSAWTTIKASAERWTSLSLTLDDSAVASREIRSLPAPPGLTELNIAIRRPCATAVHEGLFGFEPHQNNKVISNSLAHSRHLKTLSLSTFIIPLHGPIFSTLTKLLIHDTFWALNRPSPHIIPIQGKDLVRLLKVCESLEEFVFEGENTLSWFEKHAFVANDNQNDIVCLPRLRSFHFHSHHVCAARVFPYLRAPNLETMSLGLLPGYNLSTGGLLTTAILSFLGGSQNLKSLRLLASRGSSAAAVLGLPHLESLHLDRCSDPDGVVRALSEHNSFSSNAWLAPKLSNLVINAEPHLLQRMAFPLLMQRYYHHFEYGNPALLASIIINGYDLLRGNPLQNIGQLMKTTRCH